jgi:phosphoglycerate dehydrogenase-like enzyme
VSNQAANPPANPTSTRRLRIAVATRLPTSLRERIVELEPRIDLVAGDDALYPPMRFPADFGGDPAFRRTPEQQRAFEALVDSADALYGIPDVEPAALRRTVAANPRLRWVHTMAAGGGATVRAAGLDAAALERVAFTTSAGVHGASLAEFAVFGVLAGAKNLPRLTADQAGRVWPDRWLMRQVQDMTVLLLGMGGIGAQVAERLSAFGARVIGVSRSGTAAPGVRTVIDPAALADHVGAADAVVATLPGTPATERMLDAQVFAAMKPETIVVNVGRGTVIDEPALLDALDDGTVGFAALDVFATEPLPADSPLWTHPRVLVSPHTAALTHAEERRIAELFAGNATALLEGRPLLNVVDTVDFY